MPAVCREIQSHFGGAKTDAIRNLDVILSEAKDLLFLALTESRFFHFAQDDIP